MHFPEVSGGTYQKLQEPKNPRFAKNRLGRVSGNTKFILFGLIIVEITSKLLKKDRTDYCNSTLSEETAHPTVYLHLSEL